MLYDYMFKRKSVRRYARDTLDETVLGSVRNFADELMPLYPAISVRCEIVSSVKNIAPIIAPHYMLFYSEWIFIVYLGIGAERISASIPHAAARFYYRRALFA